MPDALTGFCKTDFWDLDLTWNTETPDFTSCFQNVALVWIPFGFLFLVLPMEIYSQNKSKNGYIAFNYLNLLKMFNSVALFGLALAELVWVLGYIEDYSADFLTAVIVKLIGYLVAFIIDYRGRQKGIQSSVTLFYFWLFNLLATIIIYYSKVTNLLINPELEDITVLGLYLASGPIIFLQFFLTFIADQIPKNLRHFIVENVCPEETSSYISQLLFGWLDALLIRGYKEPLMQSKLWKLGPQNRSDYLVDQFENHWLDEISKAKQSGYNVTDRESNKAKGIYQPSFMTALARSYWSSFLIGAIQKTISDFLSFVSPLMLDKVISHVTSGEPLWKGILYAFVIFGASELQSLFLSQYFLRMFLIAMKIRMSIISAVYTKALKLSNKERQESTVGEIVNLMSIDTQRFVDLMPYILMLVSAPIQITLSLYFLSQTIGISVIGGVVVMILLAPTNAVIAGMFRKLQVLDMKFKDERTKLVNEVLNGMKVLKLYAWEVPFAEMIQRIRDKEVFVLRKMAYYMAGISFIWTCAPFFVSLASFAMYVLIDDKNVLTANVAFVSISLFNLLRFPLNMLPNLITGLMQVSVSVKRLNKFLRGEELDPDVITHHHLGDDAITVEGGEFSWGQSSDRSVLSDINLNIPRGKLYAVVGQVGAGKSSLISAVLGELNKIKGKINIQGSIAYVPQQAWIQNASVRNNILMYKQFKEQTYNDILEACALKTDLEILPGGDSTEIGEKGINLSGGQKQRVSIARAVYHNSDVYLLDDPLSAVDSHVGKHIFQKVIGPSGILQSKTRLFVTNSIAYLPVCDAVIVLKDGAISEMGTYNELLSQKGAFSDFLMQYLSQEGEELDQDDLEQLDEILAKVPVSPEIQRQISKKLSESESESVHSRSTEPSPRRKRHSSTVSEKQPKKTQKEKMKLTQDESMETAEVKMSVYIAYLKHVGTTVGLTAMLLWIMSQAASVGSNVWLSEWSNDPVNPDGTVDSSLRDMRLGVYGALGVAQGLGIMLGAFGLAYGTMRAANVLHRQMLDSVLKSPMSFFDTTPIGRIVNRFSKDVNTMDVSLMMNFRGWLITLLQVISVIIVDTIETPLILVVLLPACIIYYFVQKLYIASSRQLKRLESVTRSPIYVHFSESVTGAQSIRAYGMQDIFIKEIYGRVDTNMVTYYPTIAANRWLAVRLEFVGNLIVLFASLFAVIGSDYLNPGSVGLSVSYAMSITSSLNWMVRMSSELETNIVSVERILEYSTLNSEAQWSNDHLIRNRTWPEKGQIEFNSYATKYREDLEPVLKKISCHVNPGEKVGICGRTGAGKSSLTLALFRLIEATNGSIEIDGVDISKIGLHDLRSHLTIIPQDPVLFSGTLRENLDPFMKRSDIEIWSALEHAHLKSFVQDLAEGLEHTVAEGGENLSVGQRQLVCLARALLRKTKILILDEATAAVDLETDDLIQMTIRKEFADCTILTIAHRLNTIMDSSRILVLDNGNIAEYDSPKNLLDNNKSIFHGMAKDAGLI